VELYREPHGRGDLEVYHALQLLSRLSGTSQQPKGKGAGLAVDTSQGQGVLSQHEMFENKE